MNDRIVLPAGVSELVLTSRARELSWDAPDLRQDAVSPGQTRLTLKNRDGRVLELTYSLPLNDDRPEDGIVWDGSDPWYAAALGTLLTFTLDASVPASWRVISQGERQRSEIAGGVRRETWRETRPQQEVYLIAAPFTEYLQQDQGSGLQFMAFLRQPDRELAQRYLDLTGRYIRMYEALIGEYPYEKFALVENTWESGYGMPSFTLLGPRVIRLPFIPYTSYPHEILHNWWGNSVYIDYEHGNWSEGLTAYLADHHLREQRGEGAQYRRDALQKYLNFVSTEKDFPLSEFRARHDEASQAVGYNKSLMLFHMLRRRIGEEAFFDAMSRFYLSYRFRPASFLDLKQVFEDAAGRDLDHFFDQWLRRTGAPALALDRVELHSRNGLFVARGRLRQIHAGDAYELDIPVRVTGKSGATEHDVRLVGRETVFEIDLDREPASLSVDPNFDLFRRLAPAEIPPSLGEAFGRGRLTFVVPRGANDTASRAYRAFIEPWGDGRDVRTVFDDQPLPASDAIWLLGWGNARRPMLTGPLSSGEVAFSGDTLELAGRRLARADATVVLAGRARDGRPLIWAHLGGTDPAALAHRLPHYSRVSYVVFDAGEPVQQGQWPVLDSPLRVEFR